MGFMLFSLCLGVTIIILFWSWFANRWFNNKSTFTTLILSGGGAYGMAYAGVLQYCDENDHKDILKNVSTFIGASVGALTCTMLALQIPIPQIVTFLTNGTMWERLTANRDLSLFRTEFLTTFPDYINEKMSLQGLYQIKHTDLSLLVMEFETQDILFLNKNTFGGHVLVMDALCAAIAQPLLFDPVIINSKSYIDGAVVYNFPIAEAPGRQTLGIRIDLDPSFAERPWATLKDTTRMLKYLSKNATELNIKQRLNKTYINATVIPVHLPKTLYQLQLPDKIMIQQYIQAGYTAMQQCKLFAHLK